MSVRPSVSVIVATYQRPEHLRRSLLSLGMQRGVAGEFEIVVTDDGSTDCTAEVVRDFARTVDFRVAFTTQEHAGFRLARARNQGVLASTGEYLVFLDGDCVVPPDYLQQHLRARRPRMARSGDVYRFDQPTSDWVDAQAIASGAFLNWIPETDRRRLNRRCLKDQFYSAVRHPYTPRLMGGNLGIWRGDFERVNGYDEQFVGWGCEDDDLARRLRRVGVHITTLLGYTRPVHLWHSSDPTQPKTWSEGANVQYLRSAARPARCEFGLRAPAA